MTDFLNTAIKGVGGVANGALDAASNAQDEVAKARATVQKMANVEEQLDKMERESRTKVLNGYVETAGQVRI